jgi:hypothetical protein
MLLINLFGTTKTKSVTKFMKTDSPNPHFKFAILGRTNGAQEDGHKFAIPCVKEVMGAATFETGHLAQAAFTGSKERIGETHGKLISRHLR